MNWVKIEIPYQRCTSYTCMMFLGRETAVLGWQCQERWQCQDDQSPDSKEMTPQWV